MKYFRIIFFERRFPSANMTLIQDEHPILIDTGFGSDVKETEDLIRQSGTSPGELHLIINTHYHSDHVGGNHYFQSKYGVEVAAHKWEAELINARDREACSAEWLDQPVEPYLVHHKLSDGDEITTGNRILNVLHTPGHTLGHISLYEPEEKVLVCGDLFHKDDIGWINIFREGVSSVQRSMESLDRLAALPIRLAYSGHGGRIDNPKSAIDSARERFEKWLQTPDKISWHACKRIFAYTLMLLDGLPKEEIGPYLLTCGWFQDFARHAFQLQPEEFIQVLIDEMVRSRAAAWKDDRLIATTPHRVPEKEWLMKSIKPGNWIIT